MEVEMKERALCMMQYEIIRSFIGLLADPELKVTCTDCSMAGRIRQARFERGLKPDDGNIPLPDNFRAEAHGIRFDYPETYKVDEYLELSFEYLMKDNPLDRAVGKEHDSVRDGIRLLNPAFLIRTDTERDKMVLEFRCPGGEIQWFEFSIVLVA